MTLTAVRRRLEYWLVLAVRGLTRVVPGAVSRACGTAIGWAFYVLDARHRRVAERQLQAAFPRKSRAECRAITRATFIHFGRLVVAVLGFSALSRSDMRVRVEYEGEERVRTALASGKGVIMFSGHFGYWEVLALAHALVLPPMALVARPLDNPLLHALLERMRTASGNSVIYKQGALRRILRALEQNQCVGILMDQYAQTDEAVTVDFFNRSASTTPAAATLAIRSGAALIPVFALPLSGGRYRMVYEHPVEMPSPASEDPVRELTQRCTDVLEMYVRRHPHLWLWMHRRWREAPE